MRIKRNLKIFKFVGYCPRCRGICGHNDLTCQKKPIRLKGNWVICSFCKKKFRAFSLIKASRKKTHRTAFPKQGFRRTAWRQVEFQEALASLKDALNLYEMWGEKGIEDAKQNLLLCGWTEKQIWTLTQLAANRSVWYDSNYILTRWAFEKADNPLPIIREYAR